MKVLSGAHAPDAGQMWLEAGRSCRLTRWRPGAPGGDDLPGAVLAPHLTVEENILLGLEPSRFGWIDRRAVRAKAAAASGSSATRRFALIAASRPHRGRQQLVEIARALAVGCRILVLDEPTSSLTSQDVRRLFDLIGQLKQQGLAIVYISHFLEEVKEVSDRITVLRDGRSVGEGRTAEMSIDRIVALMWP